MNYTKYTERGVGRVLHALEVYVDTPTVVDHVVVDLDKVILQKKIFATYEWQENVPCFNFMDNRYNRNQFFKKPYIDNFIVANGIVFCIHEAKTKLSIQDASALIYRRDEFPEAIIPQKIYKKVRKVIEQVYHGHVHPTEQMVQHVLDCCVLELKYSEFRCH